MCLDTVYRGKQKQEALAKLPESGYYWKVVDTKKDGYRPPFRKNNVNDTPYKSGWNKTYAKSDFAGYLLGFHLFRSRRGATIFRRRLYTTTGRIIIRCKVEKKDIINIGTQDGLCIVTTRFWCPKPRSKK